MVPFLLRSEENRSVCPDEPLNAACVRVSVGDTDQLEACAWLDNRSTASLWRLEAPHTSSVMRENSLLRLVTLPRSLSSVSNQTAELG